MAEWWDGSGKGPQRAFVCHEGPWTLKTYGNADQRWQGEFQLMGMDAEAESLNPLKFEVLHKFWSWDGDYRNYEFSGTCSRPTRLQLRVMKYKPSAAVWGSHELRLNAWDYEAEGVVAGVGNYEEEVWGKVLELDGDRLLLAGKAHSRCYVYDRVDGGGRGVGVEQDGGCGWVGGCVLNDGRVFLTSGGARCCVLDVESGEESEVLLEGVGVDYFGDAVLMDDGCVLLTPYLTTAFYVYDPAAGSLVKVAHSGLAIVNGITGERLWWMVGGCCCVPPRMAWHARCTILRRRVWLPARRSEIRKLSGMLLLYGMAGPCCWAALVRRM